MPSGSAFEHVYGQPFYDYLGEHPNSAALFHEAMTGFSELEAAAIMAAYDFFTVDSMVDVGAVASTFSRAYRTTGMTQLQRQSSENAATPGNRCSFSRGRACDSTGNAPSEAKRRRVARARQSAHLLHVSVRHGRGNFWRKATINRTPRLAVSAAPSSPPQRRSSTMRSGRGYGVSVLHHLWARYELPATHPRARTSDEEVSWRKRCSGISVKRST